MAQQLTTVTRTQGNNAALKDGTVEPKRFALAFEEVPVLVHAFRRMVRGLEFDVCEMAFTTYLCARAHGKRFTALPVFLVRGFHHGAMARSAGSGIEPKDLEGTRVGVNRGYTVTTGVWARSILQDEYGVALDRVTWVPSGDEHVAEYRPPANVVPAAAGADLVEMVADGRLAAVVGAEAAGIEAERADMASLIPDPVEAAFRSLQQRGFYPINHLVVVKDDLLAAHPELATDLFEAFAASKDLYVQRLRDGTVAEPSPTDGMYKRVLDVTGSDPLPYGVEPNRAMIEALIAHAVTQKILDRPPALESLFAAGTLDLVA